MVKTVFFPPLSSFSMHMYYAEKLFLRRVEPFRFVQDRKEESKEALTGTFLLLLLLLLLV